MKEFLRRKKVSIVRDREGIRGEDYTLPVTQVKEGRMNPLCLRNKK
jgi:hypothetical protein